MYIIIIKNKQTNKQTSIINEHTELTFLQTLCTGQGVIKRHTYVGIIGITVTTIFTHVGRSHQRWLIIENGKENVQQQHAVSMARREEEKVQECANKSACPQGTYRTILLLNTCSLRRQVSQVRSWTMLRYTCFITPRCLWRGSGRDRNSKAVQRCHQSLLSREVSGGQKASLTGNVLRDSKWMRL